MLPPAATLEWVASSLSPGSEIVSVAPLLSSRWHTCHTLRIAGPSGEQYDLVLRRWARPGWEVLDPDFDARREAAVLELLESIPLHTPVLIAIDADARWCDVPTLLMTRLAGGPPDRPVHPDRYLQQLADALVVIHGMDEAAARRLPFYRSWHDMAKVNPPPWASRSPLWRRAFDVVRGGAPDSAEAFIHRDYHPNNTLWIGDRMTGVIDWSTGSWGPISVDLAHMRWNLARELGLEAPNRFLAMYERAAQKPIAHDPYWDVVELIDGVGADTDCPPTPMLANLEGYLQHVLG